MVSYGPAFLSLTLNLDAVYIFKEPKSCGNGPYLACLIFMAAVLVVLTHLCIYPPDFQKLWWCGNMTLQFFFVKFVLEILVAEFWFPLEEAIFNMIANFVETVDQSEKLESLKTIVDLVKCETAQMASSYLLSIFFLLAALHATKVIEVKLFDYGMCPFVQDIYDRAAKFLICFLNLPEKPKKSNFKNFKSIQKSYIENIIDDGSSYWEEQPKIPAKHRPWVL